MTVLGWLVAGQFGDQALLVFSALVVVFTGRELRLVRLRATMNRALHEIRRPLQALALDSPGPSVLQAIQAVGRLDRTLNGGGLPVRRPEEIACRLMVDACVRRWLSRAHLSGAELELRWTGPDVLVRGEANALSGAIENLILNAIEHGGPEIRIEAMAVGRWVRIEVIDSGRGSRPPGREASPAEVIAKQRGDGGHGHGLEIVRRAVADHSGKFDLTLGERGSTATIALPCLTAARRRGSIRVNW